MKEHKKKVLILKRREKGITLIALVITIIVLLILAGVSIAMLTGENGILTQASNAKLETEYSSVTDTMGLAVNEYVTEKQTNTTELSFIDWLKEKGYINKDNEIQVGTLLGQELSTGKGSGTSDVYKLEESVETAKLASTVKVAATVTAEEDKKYDIVYYNEKGERNLLKTISVRTTEQLEETDPSLFEVEDGVLYLKDYASYYNGSKQWTIEDVVIPSEVNGQKVTAIGDAFEYNTVIKSVVIPEGVKSLSDSFRFCENLESVVFPDSLQTIDGAFWGCESLKDVTLPSNLERIGSFAFYGCSLTRITIPNKVKEIGEDAFCGTGLTSITIPNSVTSIGSSAFKGCSSLSSITIPSSVTSIEANAFYGCTSISSITIPSSITSMGAYVFSEWTEEQTINVPFKQGELPEGWNASWNGGNAHIEYAK